MAACFTEDARFSVGSVGKHTPFAIAVKAFEGFIARAKSIKMTVRPGSTRAVGPMVTLTRVDEMVMQDGSNTGSGTWFSVYGLKGGKIAEYVDFQIG